MYKRELRKRKFNTVSLDYRDALIDVRDFLTNKLIHDIDLMRDFARITSEDARYGKLNNRKLHKYTYDDNIFHSPIVSDGGDTTVVFLLDNSGSMLSNSKIQFGGKGLELSKYQTCTLIASAFAKAAAIALPNEIHVEVFNKDSDVFDITRGNVNTSYKGVSLTKLYSSSKSNNSEHNDYEFNRILKQSCCVSPFGSSGATPELACLPGLKDWASRNIFTKNVFIVNLTDGMPTTTIGLKEYNGLSGERKEREAYFNMNSNAKMNRMYGSFFDMITVYIGSPNYYQSWKDDIDKMYGEGKVIFTDPINLPNKLMKTLGSFLDSKVK